jgi:drug/metabolite transporter (DMT)-like permease
VERRLRPLFALVLRLGSALSFATLLMMVKYAGQSGVALPEIMFWRQAVCLPIIVGWLTLSGNLHQLRTQRIKAHGGRALVGMTNMVFNFGAAILLPLSMSTTLGFTAPLFAVLLAVLVFREKVGPFRWTAVALGFSGILIVARPGDEAISHLGVVMGLICALMTAVINYQIRDLGRTETSACVVFWFSLFGTLITAPMMPLMMVHHTPFQWLILAGLGLFGAFGQLLMTASLRHGAVASVIVIDYTSLIWATGYGWLVWNHFPSTATFIGAPLIIAAGIVIAWREHRLSHAIAVSPVESD